MTRRTNTKSRLLSSAVALTLFSTTTLLQTAHASLSCASPSGSYQVGNTVRLELSGNSWWPRLQDVYSITANVYCSSGSGTVASMSISNGDSWTIPESALGKCSGDKMYVQLTGQMYDLAHLAHILPYWESCDALFITPAPPKPTTTTTTKAPTVPPTQPPTQQPPATTTTVPTEVPPTTTNPPTQQPPTTATTTSYSPIYTTTYTLVPTVISGTSTVISVTTVLVVTPTALPPVLTSSGLPTNGTIVPTDNSQLPGLPPSPGGDSNNSTNKSGGNTNVPAAALGAVGGVAALALIVFGLVVTRRRRRMREEQAASVGLGSKDDYYYDGASSFGPGTGGALAGAGAGALYAGAAERHSSDDRSMPSLHQYPPVHPPVDVSDSYGWDLNTSYAAAGAAGSSSAAAGDDSTLLPFPIPATTSDALKQQYDLANRLSVVSQDDSMLGFPLVPKSSPPQAPASATAAYALNQQMSLKQELDNEDDAAFAAASPVVAGGESPELYYLPVSGGSGASAITSPSQAFLSARGSPGATSASVAEGGARSSVYETVHSSSSAYATADSPTWSAASLQSHDIAIPMPSSSGGGSGSGSGGGHQNIQDLIRDVLRDD
ncbi:hypothetical protein EC957_000400 [Mortierella hygrophila]|uniref:Uncharacterized protein n=1 Tax=Mortierella hygrophila TaxID=979708 RepID=A0A9P6F7S5_9FUNG|nr:hypothetical protein EC957_000400 [Mortierella hygrophila]